MGSYNLHGSLEKKIAGEDEHFFIKLNKFILKQGGDPYMDYWVYENWQARGHKAVIHRGDCGHCNHGRGLSGQGTAPKHGRWLGPYPTLQDAERAAHNTGGRVIYHQCV
jgi:hypothetical protein